MKNVKAGNQRAAEFQKTETLRFLSKSFPPKKSLVGLSTTENYSNYFPTS